MVHSEPQPQPCSGFPWTPEWQKCFQDSMANVRRNAAVAVNSANRALTSSAIYVGNTNIGGGSLINMDFEGSRVIINGGNVRTSSVNVYNVGHPGGGGTLDVTLAVDEFESMNKTVGVLSDQGQGQGGKAAAGTAMRIEFLKSGATGGETKLAAAAAEPNSWLTVKLEGGPLTFEDIHLTRVGNDGVRLQIASPVA